ncbi:hypothetical protein N5E15_22015 [Pantoea stewartii]|uniref:hypothetical protein n=1 Tax=Pantoea stewartii TaxID=66269 RepID=UPI0021D48EEF|nr:hypothetical protein [Pantoea stewartii]MCU7369255.1 hypothetical protein [Pantoea stewartii]
MADINVAAETIKSGTDGINAWVPVFAALAGGLLTGSLSFFTNRQTHRQNIEREAQAAAHRLQHENQLSDRKVASQRAYIGSQLIVILAGYREACADFARCPVKDDVAYPSPEAPDFSGVKGDWTVLEGELLLRIHRLVFTRTRNDLELKAVFSEFADGQEYLSGVSQLYDAVTGECDRIISELCALCDLPSPWLLDE